MLMASRLTLMIRFLLLLMPLCNFSSSNENDANVASAITLNAPNAPTLNSGTEYCS